jgi:hypothetical protein
LLQGGDGVYAPLIIQHGAGWLPMPLGPVQEVDEVDPQRLLGLANLPVLASPAALQSLAEPAHLVRQRLVGRRAGQELPHPAHEIRPGLLAHQLRSQQVLPEPL